MKKQLSKIKISTLLIIVSIFFISWCDWDFSNETKNYNNIENSKDGYNDWYSWAEDNDINNFDDCQNQYWTSEAENGCNDYVKNNHTGNKEFNWYECTEDCSWHEAWYNWAEENNIDDIDNCDWNSQSFNEGCESYVEENN